MNSKAILTIYTSICFFLISCEKNKSETKPVYKKLTEAVYASGNIYPKNDYQVFANADGFLVDLMVSEGASVVADQPLFRIESDIQDVRYQTAYDVYQKAQENYQENSPALKELRTGIETSRIKLANDSLNYLRYKKLMENNATSEMEYERISLMYQQSQNDYQARVSNYSRVKNQLYIDLKNAESLYKISMKEKSNFIVKSFISGTVYEIYKKRGEAVRRNDAIALVGDSSEMYIKLVVDELDIMKVAVGQVVLIKVDVDKEKIFRARVTKIYPKLNKADQSFRVDAHFEGLQPANYYGLTVEANIVVATKDMALTIPKSYLLSKDSVWIMDQGVERKVKVSTGIEDFDYVEILSGLTQESIVLKK